MNDIFTLKQILAIMDPEQEIAVRYSGYYVCGNVESIGGMCLEPIFNQPVDHIFVEDEILIIEIG